MKKEKNLESLLDPNSAKLSDEQLSSATGGSDDWRPIYVVECLKCQILLGEFSTDYEAYQIKWRHQDEFGVLGPALHNVQIRVENR